MKGSPTRVTADGVVGVEDKPTKVYAISIDSGASAGVVTLRNGDGTGDPATLNNLTGQANSGYLVPGIPADGVYFPDGVYADFGTPAPDAVTIWHEAVSTS